jgi:putative endonuclease
MNANDRFGREGEDLAARYLQDAGLRVIDRRWRTKTGELDLVAMDGDEVVFVEVKTRRDAGFGAPEEAVTRAKREHLRQSAVAWLDAHRRAGRPYRIDVVAVEGTAIRHVRDAVGEAD